MSASPSEREPVQHQVRDREQRRHHQRHADRARVRQRILGVHGQRRDQLAGPGDDVPAVPARKAPEEDAEPRQPGDGGHERPARRAARRGVRPGGGSATATETRCRAPVSANANTIIASYQMRHERRARAGGSGRSPGRARWERTPARPRRAPNVPRRDGRPPGAWRPAMSTDSSSGTHASTRFHPRNSSAARPRQTHARQRQRAAERGSERQDQQRPLEALVVARPHRVNCKGVDEIRAVPGSNGLMSRPASSFGS